MKKAFTVILSLILALSMSFSAFAISVIMNSRTLEFPDQQPVIVNGRTLVPIRPVAEKLGLEVGWDAKTRTVTVSKDDFYIKLTIDDNKAETSNGVVELDQSATIIGDRTVVPLRFIAEAFGLTVDWNGDYQRIIITGKVDTKKKAETATVSGGGKQTAGGGTADVDGGENAETVVQTGDETESEEEEETSEDMILTAGDKTIIISVPSTFSPEDELAEFSAESDVTYGNRAVDATDIQHGYSASSVVEFFSFADADGQNGIVGVTQYLGEVAERDALTDEQLSQIDRVTEPFPERPQQPSVSYYELFEEFEILTMAEVEKIYEEAGVELPEFDEEGYTYEQIAEDCGLEVEAVEERLSSVDYSEIPAYVEWTEYQTLYNEWQRDYYELRRIKDRVLRRWSDVSDKLDNETWAAFFTEMYNTDPEVVYTDVEIVDFGGEKAVHCTILAQDADDMQGTFDAYFYYNGDYKVTIYGGSLDASEAAAECISALANMNIS